MKQKIKTTGIIILFVVSGFSGLSQKATAVLPLTADSIATGNYKDVFKSFFQLALDRFTGPQKEIQFTSNPFAVMAKLNPDLLIDRNYIRYTHLRNLNFSFGGKLDASYKFNGFSSGVKYALINERDETISRAFVVSAMNANREVNVFNDAFEQRLSTIPLAQRKLFRDEKTKLFKGTKTFSQLDATVQRFIQNLIAELNLTGLSANMEADADFNLHTFSQNSYDSLKNLFQKNLLWTVGISDTTYTNQFLFSNIVLSTEVLKGISAPSRTVGVEINVKGAWNFLDDTLKAGSDLQRNLLQVEPGLNLVFKTKGNQYPWAEFKLSGSYIHTFKGLYAGEKKDSVTVNGTFRIRILNDIWIPLEIKYNPRSGNVFGFLNVRANFSGLKDLFSSGK